VVADFPCDDHALVTRKFKRRATRFALLRVLWRSRTGMCGEAARACVAELHKQAWRRCTSMHDGTAHVLVMGMRKPKMNRCDVFLRQLTKKMHQTRRFMTLFVDMLLRKAE
jgi:hypothetical protein